MGRKPGAKNKNVALMESYLSIFQEYADKPISDPTSLKAMMRDDPQFRKEMMKLCAPKIMPKSLEIGGEATAISFNFPKDVKPDEPDTSFIRHEPKDDEPDTDQIAEA